MINIKKKIDTFCKWFDKMAEKKKKAIIIIFVVLLFIFSPLGWVKQGFYFSVYGESIHTAAFAFPGYCFLETDVEDNCELGYGYDSGLGYRPTDLKNAKGCATDTYYSVGRFFVIDDAYCVGVSVGRYLFIYNRKTFCDNKFLIMRWKGRNRFTKKEEQKKIEEIRKKIGRN